MEEGGGREEIEVSTSVFVTDDCGSHVLAGCTFCLSRHLRGEDCSQAQAVQVCVWEREIKIMEEGLLMWPVDVPSPDTPRSWNPTLPGLAQSTPTGVSVDSLGR